MSETEEKRIRIYSRLNSQDHARMKYWAEQRGESESEFIEDAIKDFIAHLNGDYDLPTLEQQRLNQLTDVIIELTAADRALSAVVTNGFKSLLSMARGNNYLMDADVGDFDFDDEGDM